VKYFFDTSVLVATAVAHHPHHAAGSAVYRQVINGKHSGAVSSHALAETFSTLTRLPLSPMIHPSEAYRFLTDTVVRYCETVTLGESDYLAMLESAAKTGLRGGIVYDALHLQCAQKSRCDRIYTFNFTDFIRLAPQLQSKIVIP
jgi:predicted nucleic acid-binding protein